MSDHLETLRQYQQWRRGGERELLPPKVIGEAIDAVMGELTSLRAAIRQTLDENGHLADGDNCTLIALKRAVPEWETGE